VGDALTIDGGTLDLRGFMLTGGAGHGIMCTRACTVTSDPSGGAIQVSTGGAVVGTAGVRITVKGTDLSGSGIATGISALGSKITLQDVSISDVNDAVVGGTIRVQDSMIQNASHRAVIAAKAHVEDSDIVNAGRLGASDRIVLLNSTIAGGSGDGIGSGGSVKVINSTITGNAGSGIAGGSPNITLKVVRSDISNNGQKGVLWYSNYGSVSIRESTISGNVEEGVFSGGTLRISRASSVTGNGLDGVSSGLSVPTECDRITITDSTITGNGTDADCGVSITCADITWCREPSVRDTSCDTSYDTNSGFPGTNWGVCALD
jgi:hypothetical protein